MAGLGTWLDSAAPVPQHHTTGINCERCLPGFYRAPDHPLDSPHVCRREWGLAGLLSLGHGGPNLQGLPRRGGWDVLGSRIQEAEALCLGVLC